MLERGEGRIGMGELPEMGDRNKKTWSIADGKVGNLGSYLVAEFSAYSTPVLKLATGLASMA